MQSHTNHEVISPIPLSMRSAAAGALYGLAIGDALGMPTQSMPREWILQDYGRLEGFRAAGPRQAIAAGMPAGTVTDDTEQAVMVGELLVSGDGRIEPLVFASSLMRWEQSMKDRGSLDLLGPSTKAAVEIIRQGGDPEDAGRYGTTNGAAMRIAPVGIAVECLDMATFLDSVVNASMVTHNTSLGIAGAAAVSAAVSAGVAGARVPEALEYALAAAREGSLRGHWIAGADIADRSMWAISHLKSLTPSARADALYNVVGTSVASQESVTCALALVALDEDPFQTLLEAAGLGGDTDTIAAMAGAMLGAVHGLDGWPAGAVETIRTVNDLHLEPLANDLLHLRLGTGA
ncbi:ADP-ribosylglycohydrolase family protein [Arthrobacter sp. 35W]|uniref:ADP-ribosylglycohydrolase family protein n=1 Tax=Arthrobacter sp. 35W TaxID=1132441 RepID=UPI0003F68866|nr:ADP-ribosylglycohydrolase family protein [Arthrobacter sp. 35W]